VSPPTIGTKIPLEKRERAPRAVEQVPLDSVKILHEDQAKRLNGQKGSDREHKWHERITFRNLGVARLTVFQKNRPAKPMLRKRKKPRNDICDDRKERGRKLAHQTEKDR